MLSVGVAQLGLAYHLCSSPPRQACRGWACIGRDREVAGRLGSVACRGRVAQCLSKFAEPVDVANWGVSLDRCLLPGSTKLRRDPHPYSKGS